MMTAPIDDDRAGPAYANAEERQRHGQHIEAMATELQRSVQEVAACYETVLTRLLAQARIRDYLPLLVAKQVRSVLRTTCPKEPHGR